MSRDVASRRFGDETVLLNLETGQYHGLDATGTQFLAILEAHDLDDAVTALASQFDVDPDRMRGEVASFYSQLAARRLLDAARDVDG